MYTEPGGTFLAHKSYFVWEIKVTSLAQLKIGLKLVFDYIGVIFDIVDDVGRWSGRHLESLMKIHHDLADWLHLGHGGHWGFLTGDLEDVVIFDIINHVSIWFRKISWKFDEDLTWFRSGLNLGLGGSWGFLTGELEDGVIFDIIGLVGRMIWKISWKFDEGSVMIKMRNSLSRDGVGLVFLLLSLRISLSQSIWM